MPQLAEDIARALEEIERSGVLLLQDPRLPSLAALLAGEVVRGSWWGHPAGSRIFHTAGVLDDHDDVATFKLVGEKVCFVHRRLWPAIVAIGRAREPWQTEGLDAEAQALLERVEREGRVRASGPSAKKLEARLLVASEQVHTERGAHATELSSWARFVIERRVRRVPRSVEAAKKSIEAAVDGMGAPARLPWPPRRRT